MPCSILLSSQRHISQKKPSCPFTPPRKRRAYGFQPSRNTAGLWLSEIGWGSLWLGFSHFLTLNRVERFAKLSFVLCIFLLLLSHVGCDSEKTVAKKADEGSTREEIEAPSKGIPENTKRFKDSVEIMLFSEEARKAGLENDPEVKQTLEGIKNDILARHFVRTYIDKQAYPSEEEVRKYHLGHKDEFVVPEGVFIQHILVKNEKQAEELLNALKEGASLEALAKENSICRCWKKGGRHGWLPKGGMEPELEKVVLRLQKGKLSDVVKTKAGYQIIKILDNRLEREITFEEAKEKIWSKLFLKRRKELIDRYYVEAKVDSQPTEQGVLAKVGDEAIREETIAPILAKLSENEKEKAMERWISYLIETKVFSEEARRVNLEKDPEVASELRRRINWAMASAFRKRFIIDKINISDKDIEQYYQSHLEAFRIPLRVRARSILVKTKEEAEGILKEIKAGVPFVDLAVKKSIHPLASRAGEVGWFGKGEKDPALEKAAFALEKGQMSDVIKTEAGYEIIKLMNKKGGDIKPLDEVRQAIEIKLRIQRFEEEKQRYLGKAKG